MALIPAVITSGALQYWPQFFGRLLGISAGSTTAGHWNPFFRSFKYGRGGWVNNGGGPVPRAPDPTLTDLDIILDAGRSGGSKRYPALAGNIYFMEKTLADGNFAFSGPSNLVVTCTLGVNDFNDIAGTATTPPGGGSLSPSGVNPDLYELGIFCDHPSGTGELMVMYATFPVETKISGQQIINGVILGATGG
jgi:hypothetical protein